MLIYIENASCKKGWNMNDIFNEVHNANMRKRWPEDNAFHRDNLGKVIKPPGWIAPDILKVVKSWSK
jgi:predicted HAD superfamily Cof-like phosphohydrolase